MRIKMTKVPARIALALVALLLALAITSPDPGRPDARGRTLVYVTTTKSPAT